MSCLAAKPCSIKFYCKTASAITNLLY